MLFGFFKNPILLISLLLSGCAIPLPAGQDHAKVAGTEITIGVSTRNDVLNLLGQPDSKNNSETLFGYKSHSFGVVVIGLGAGIIGANERRLVVEFSRSGVVKRMSPNAGQVCDQLGYCVHSDWDLNILRAPHSVSVDAKSMRTPTACTVYLLSISSSKSVAGPILIDNIAVANFDGVHLVEPFGERQRYFFVAKVKPGQHKLTSSVDHLILEPVTSEFTCIAGNVIVIEPKGRAAVISTRDWGKEDLTQYILLAYRQFR